MIVDVHTHCLRPQHWGREFDEHWKPIYGYDYPDHTPAEFDAAMSAGNVDVAVVFGLTAAAVGVRTPHEFVAQFCRETSTPTVGFMSLDPLDADVFDQVDEGMELGLRGVKLYPVLAGFSPADEDFRPFFDLLEKRGLVVLWHMGGSPSPESTLKYSQPLQLDDVARRHRGLRQIIAHMGHPWQRDTVQVLRSNSNVYADVSGLWARPFDGYLALMNAVEWGVVPKLLFGSDFPLWAPGDAQQGLRTVAAGSGAPLPAVADAVVDEIVNRDTCALLGLELTGA
ncbi:MAG TPA: amidohydrolase family protein [Acidimicrobiales bacterium]|nr:amidohydrolase family protein [Acidimicrobiales bacterium]